MENLPIKTIMTVNVLWEIKCVPVYASLPLPCHDWEDWRHRRRIVRVWVVNNSARPWEKEAGGHPDPLVRGWGVGAVSKKMFLQASVWSENKGAGPPGPFPWIRNWIKLMDGPRTIWAPELFIRPLDHLVSQEVLLAGWDGPLETL